MSAAIDSGYLVTDISCNYEHTCVRTGDGAVLCWGGDDGGQLGYEYSPGAAATRSWGGTDQSEAQLVNFYEGAPLPTPAPSLSPLPTALPTPAPSMSPLPTPIPTSGDLSAQAFGLANSRTCALSQFHNLACWGYDTEGSMGLCVAGDSTGAYPFYDTPQRVEVGGP